ncbi:group III truncated hemoglobin [Desertivirga arenae]|uniref:group III truncated hemoglobin n=1 Tax=Desertivirga arenae TaxID=2810309 RepID=UPI001A95FFFE|nr:group III truncated hemoglobin [Pedobacter sp. SYSU D00823]
MKADIKTREDIETLVNAFYEKVQKDELIGFIFNEVAKVNWEAHLPKMYEFFETIILGQKGFKGNPMEVHFHLNKQTPLQNEHFDRWKSLFFLTIDENFKGTKAEEAKQKATSIADLMYYKITTAADGVQIRNPSKTKQ